MKISQYLEKMLAFYDSPKKWTQGVFFANSKDEHVGKYSRDIQSCCLSGCIQLHTKSGKIETAIRDSLRRSNSGLDNGIVFWNDDSKRRFEDVINAIHNAIEYQKTEEKVSKKKG